MLNCYYQGTSLERIIDNASRDRGPGVAAAHADKVFELFRRGVGRDVSGIGVGLAIARQIATRHDGQASLVPRAGDGTDVYLTFGR